MELYIGGYAQGKLNYVLENKNLQDYIVIDEKTEFLDNNKIMILNHFHLFFKKLMEQNKEPERIVFEILDRCPDIIIICDEIGNGIVPIDAFEREYRERLGNVLIKLAKKAERVERVICAMGQRLK